MKTAQLYLHVQLSSLLMILHQKVDVCSLCEFEDFGGQNDTYAEQPETSSRVGDPEQKTSCYSYRGVIY